MVDYDRHHQLKRHLHRTLFVSILGAVLVSAVLAMMMLFAVRWIDDNKSQNQQAAAEQIDTILQDQQAFTLPDGTSNIPKDLDPTTLLDVVAKNQPAVVRVVTIYCADLRLTHQVYSYTIDDACNGGVGSGSFISSDGYIATNGHVVVVSERSALAGSLDTVEKIDTYLDFAVLAGLMTAKESASIKTGVRTSDDTAFSALDSVISGMPIAMIEARNAQTLYGIQLGNDPMRVELEGDRLAISYSNTVIPAMLTDSDFDPETATIGLQTGQFTTSDVALLKADGSFPYVELGDVGNLSVGDQLTAIGFPALVDNALDTDKWQTVPSITQGRVLDITIDADTNGRKIVGSDVQIAQGSSGGPSFNNAGQQVGLNTYGDFECGDASCFGNAHIRDVADVRALVVKNNITLKTGGITDTWSIALSDYAAGNYSKALEGLGKVQDQYPANYMVAPLARVAREHVGSTTDTSTAFQTTTVIAIVYGILAGAVVIIVVTVVLLIIYFTHRHNTAVAREGVDSSP
jgi:S1-C subfamily serine protease